MNKIIFITIITAFLSSASAMGWFFSDESKEETKVEKTIVNPTDIIKKKDDQKSLMAKTPYPTDYILGDPNSKVKIVEYSSMTCPHCADFHTKIYPEIKKKYISTKKVSYTFRHYPLDRMSFHAAMITHCAGAKKYNKFVEVFLKTQVRWALSTDYLKNLKTIAKLGGMSEENVDKCINDKELEDKILTEIQERAIKKYNVKGTPSIFINGVELSPDKRSVEGMSKVIDKLLK